MKIIVYHGTYGCDTGCCGHVIEDPDDDFGSTRFVFDHQEADESAIEFAKRVVAEEFGPEHVADLDWDSCEVRNYRH